ncbi:protease B nonderepressible form [Coemansia spiralis]|uniref:Protein PBN1 n=2 Tax=Coemansia TaxID=4863 RepID=A0A9W8G315_9FUNG|nr:protease B nonderepressible form [Coemansia umbellata]KAJ2621049.1 protease B nonderepressible form [Coemansia sp. RSA 1358]KAJ2669267.1 protease B nonderepressible form [Coemansia spiralis]
MVSVSRKTRATASLLALAALATWPPGVCSLSHSNMKRPPYGQITNELPSFETENHVIFGQDVSSTNTKSSDDGRDGWHFESIGASWHAWTYESLFDKVDLPLWPETMQEARVIVSSEMCRQRLYLPPAPFMPPRGLEHCGTHVSATARPDLNKSNGYSIGMTRLLMRRWLAAFMGWSPANDGTDNIPVQEEQNTPATKKLAQATAADGLGPESFIDFANSSIYYFHPFPSQIVDSRPESRLNLAKLAIGPQHPLRDLITPRVMHKGKQWLDNYRIEVRLHRTSHGFVKISIQLISLLHPATDINIVPTENATSHVTWIGPTKDTMAFTLSTGQSKPDSLQIPESFYAQHETSTNPSGGGQLTERTHEFYSFHPSLLISAKAEPHPHLSAGSCRIETIQTLPRSYFFDPYQLYDISAELGMQYHHYGEVELERPAETISSWGSMLVISQYPHLDSLNVSVPIHARYRLPPIHERTVGYHGEPSGNTHVDVTLLPALAAVVCPVAEVPKTTFNNSVLDSLNLRLALFHELGLDPVSSLEISPDTDTLLRMPIGDADSASLVQTLTLVALFLGTAFIALSLCRMKKKETPENKPQPKAKK